MSQLPLWAMVSPRRTAKNYQESIDQPFPIMAWSGNGNGWVVGPSYLGNHVLVWSSTNGGSSYGTPTVYNVTATMTTVRRCWKTRPCPQGRSPCCRSTPPWGSPTYNQVL